MKKNYFVHESSYVEKGAAVGKGTKIWYFSHISRGARIGMNCTIGQNVFIGGDAVVGSGVKIQNNVSVYDKITLEDYVFCGPSCVFTNVFNPRSEYPRNKDKEFRRTLVRRGATIGANATVVCGCAIGRYAFIGAGSVVTKDVPAYALLYGNPARAYGWMCECGIKLKFKKAKALCKECRKEYRLENKIVERVR
jgi:UDP-2-acetamido-3-amino-2,3-dideoxy-glucuronate N-acetyltransferase